MGNTKWSRDRGCVPVRRNHFAFKFRFPTWFIQGVPEKNAHSFKHHNCATAHNGVMPFSAKCSERNPKLRNTLPLNVRQTSNTQTFKRKLKHSYFVPHTTYPLPLLPPQTDILCSFRVVFLSKYSIVFQHILSLILPHICYRLVSACCCKPLLIDIIIIIF